MSEADSEAEDLLHAMVEFFQQIGSDYLRVVEAADAALGALDSVDARISAARANPPLVELLAEWPDSIARLASGVRRTLDGLSGECSDGIDELQSLLEQLGDEMLEP